jgi:uncharacterized protein
MKIFTAVMDGQEIAGRLRMADTFLTRLKGLTGVRELTDEEGLIIRPCSQIHTMGMKIPIDVIFLTKSGVVVHFEQGMLPGKFSRYISKAWQVVELRSGTIAARGITVNQCITFHCP